MSPLVLFHFSLAVLQDNGNIVDYLQSSLEGALFLEFRTQLLSVASHVPGVWSGSSSDRGAGRQCQNSSSGIMPECCMDCSLLIHALCVHAC